MAHMHNDTILELPIVTINARLGGQLQLACCAGVWRCNGYQAPTLAQAISRALRQKLRGKWRTSLAD